MATDRNDDDLDDDDLDDGPEDRPPEERPPAGRAADRWAQVLGLAAYVFRRFTEGRCLRMAAGLSYTSLLAIVPLTAIAFAMLAAFPAFEGVREQAQNMLFANVLPESASAVRGHLDTFVANTSTLSTFGIVGLALTAILLLGTIEADMNAIFRASRPRPLAPRLLVFWALITLGPLLFGASVSLTTYFFAATEFMGVDVLAGPLGKLAGLAPVAILVVMLTGAYIVIPNRPVSLEAALWGGAFAAVAFTLLRKVFAWYVAAFPAYQTMYGAVSVVPVSLV
ncbi:MAG: YihY family inner membrane protein, partial [Proteobacteria bacterium]|nr:YihY family inner membrane protein [Pseudomonadota bacterium]